MRHVYDDFDDFDDFDFADDAAVRALLREEERQERRMRHRRRKAALHFDRVMDRDDGDDFGSYDFDVDYDEQEFDRYAGILIDH